MRTFKDSDGRDWAIEIDVPARGRVLTATEFDLLSVLEPGQIEKLSDPVTLVAVLHSLCVEQVAKLNLTPDQFAHGMRGDALDDAAEALMGAIADFFPKRQRLVMNKALAKGTQIADDAVNQALAKIDALALPSSNASSTSKPESPASTQSQGE